MSTQQQTMGSQQQGAAATWRPPGGDTSSGADLGLVDSYLLQLLPALASVLEETQGVGHDQSLTALGLDRTALLAAGLPQHMINGLYRALAAHAGAFRKLMSGEVQQLRQLLAQHAGQQLSGTIQLLDGPIAAAAAAPSQILKATNSAATQQLQAHQQQLQQQRNCEHVPLLNSTAAGILEATGALPAGPGQSAGGGFNCEELMKDYVDAYVSMKDNLEIRLRHEQRRADHLQGKLQQTEGNLRDTSLQLEAANKRVAERRAEAAELQSQLSELQSSLAASHAAHLALQQHHTAQMEAAAQQKQELEEQHKATVEALHTDLATAAATATALTESNRQVDALRLLYNEELARASRLAVELSRATAAADKAAAEEESWRRQLQKSDSRADNAEGMANAMHLNVRQLEAQLREEQERLHAARSEAAQLRVMYERSRLAAVEDPAAAHAVVTGLASKLSTTKADLAIKSSALSTAEDNLKLRAMELEGANTHLQASRLHLKQLMSDLETEQDKSAGLATAAAELRTAAAEAAAAREVAESRVTTLQSQLSSATDANALMSQQLADVCAVLEEQTSELHQLQDDYHAEHEAHDALKRQAEQLQERLTELAEVEEQLVQLKQEHKDTTVQIAELEQANTSLTTRVAELQLSTQELQQLQNAKAALEVGLAQTQQQLADTTANLQDIHAQATESACQVVQLQIKLAEEQQKKEQLTERLDTAVAAGNAAMQQAADLSQELHRTQAKLDTAESDRQALAAQRDGWMTSFQEAYGKLQEWTTAKALATHKLAARAGTIQAAMQGLNQQVAAKQAATDSAAAGGAAVADETGDFVSNAVTAAAFGQRGADEPAAATTAAANVLDQMAALQQLMQAELSKQQEEFEATLKAMADRVEQRQIAAQAWWDSTVSGHKQQAAKRGKQGAAADAAEAGVTAAVQEASSSITQQTQATHGAFDSTAANIVTEQTLLAAVKSAKAQEQIDATVAESSADHAVAARIADGTDSATAAMNSRTMRSSQTSDSATSMSPGSDGQAGMQHVMSNSAVEQAILAGSQQATMQLNEAYATAAIRAGPGSDSSSPATANDKQHNIPAASSSIEGSSSAVSAVHSTFLLDIAHSTSAEDAEYIAGVQPSSTTNSIAGGLSDNGGVPKGGFLSGFVSLAMYQEQMQSMAKLHKEVGQMVVQLREAHADTEGAQQQLQHHRQEAAARTTALHGALNQLHTQLAELRNDHAALQDAHRSLVAKDLMQTGLLKDRYVADLFGRLQEAEWKLDTARKRACTWGYEMMVPLGRHDRAIQTQYAEIWAGEQVQQQQGQQKKQKCQQQLREAPSAGVSKAIQQHQRLKGGSSTSSLAEAVQSPYDPGVGMSANTGTVGAGTADGTVARKQPNFTQHSTGSSNEASSSTTISSRIRPDSYRHTQAQVGSSTGLYDTSSSGAVTSAFMAAATDLSSTDSVQAMPAAQLLQCIAGLYDSKAAADATALRAHAIPLGLWEFAVQQTQKQHGTSTSSSSSKPGTSMKDKMRQISNETHQAGMVASGGKIAAHAALAQLLSSVKQHAGTHPEVAQFKQALMDSRLQYVAAQQQQASRPIVSDGTAVDATAVVATSRNVASPGSARVLRGPWGELRLDNSKLAPEFNPSVLLPPGAAALVENMLAWPGMMPLLRWVAEGHFLVGLREGDLGKTLVDVQAPHVHFLLLEAADILQLHPLPKVQIIQQAAPFARLLQVPTLTLHSIAGDKPAAAAGGSSASRDSSTSSKQGQQQQQPQQKFGWQRQALLVLSSAALQLLHPAELQTLMAAALAPAVLAGISEAEASSPSSSQPSSRTKAAAPDPFTPGMGELATLTSLLALQPSVLLSRLPPEMHAMGSCLAAALLAAERLVAVTGDRSGLVVCQDVQISVSAVIKASRRGPAAAAGGANEMAVEYLQQVETQAAIVPDVQQLLPQHEALAGKVSSSGSSGGSKSSGEVQQLSDEEVLLLRVHQLASWAESDEYKQMMAVAKPLRRVLPPATRNKPST